MSCMNTIPVKRLLCLLLALILCVGAMPPAASAQETADEAETAVSLPESIDDFHMKVAIECPTPQVGRAVERPRSD